MSIPKEPRSLMIQLMYLVLTAMLALNITREVLEAFKTIDASIVRSNNSINDKNLDIYNELEQREQNPDEKAKVAPFNTQAKKVKTETDDIMVYVQSWKDSVINRSGGWITKDDGTQELKSMEDIDAAARIFIQEKNGDVLKQRLLDYRNFLLEQVNPSAKETFSTNLPLVIADYKKTEDNPKGDWAYGLFHNMPVVGTIAMLSKFQNDVKNSEAAVLEHLKSQIGMDDWKFDEVRAIATPKTSYALVGQEIEAEIVLAAYNKTANPSMTSSAGSVVVKDGLGILKFKASGVGSKTVNGKIEIDKAGKKMSYPFSFDYTVGNSGASLQLDYMNVMYIGVENPVTLSASGYNIEDVKLEMPEAELKSSGNGKYDVRVKSVKTITYKIKANRGKEAGKEISSGEIRVKRIPDPVAKVGMKSQGPIATSAAKIQTGILADLENFDFKARFVVTSFRFFYVPKIGDAQPIEVKGNRFGNNPACADLMKRSKPGDKWIFENIKAVGPDGDERTLNTISLTLN